jgi:PIN domain nuclease of toxin-antitoxin system
MRILLDTHAFFWWVTHSRYLSSTARQLIEDGANEILVSPVSAWELANKFRLGKLPEAESLVDEIDWTIETSGFRSLPIMMNHAKLAGLLPGDHRDPFDRMLAAQARLEDVPLVTTDRAFRDFHIEMLW